MVHRSRADETRITDPQQLPKLDKYLLVPIHQLCRRDPRLLRRTFNIHAVLIRARQVRHIKARHPSVPRDHVAHDRRIRRPHVRPRIRIVNRRRKVVLRPAIKNGRIFHKLPARLRFAASLLSCFLASLPQIQSSPPPSPALAARRAQPRSSSNPRTPASHSRSSHSCVKPSSAPNPAAFPPAQTRAAAFSGVHHTCERQSSSSPQKSNPSTAPHSSDRSIASQAARAGSSSSAPASKTRPALLPPAPVRQSSRISADSCRPHSSRSP